MRPWALSTPLAAGLLLAGCAATQSQVATPSTQLVCESGKACTVNVAVTCDRFFGCDVAVDAALVLVTGRRKITDIEWVLTGEPGASFASNGIALDSVAFDCKPGADRKSYRCSDKHPDFGVFRYTVNVSVPKSAFGPRGATAVDRWIVND